jgi:hypothetical protein
MLILGTLSCRSRQMDATAAPPSVTVQLPPMPSAEEQARCIDSDVSAPDPRYVAGKVTITDVTGKTTTMPDACDAEHYVREGRCPEDPTEIDAQLGYYFLAYCANGCREGACLP